MSGSRREAPSIPGTRPATLADLTEYAWASIGSRDQPDPERGMRNGLAIIVAIDMARYGAPYDARPGGGRDARRLIAFLLDGCLVHSDGSDDWWLSWPSTR